MVGTFVRTTLCVKFTTLHRYHMVDICGACNAVSYTDRVWCHRARAICYDEEPSGKKLKVLYRLLRFIKTLKASTVGLFTKLYHHQQPSLFDAARTSLAWTALYVRAACYRLLFLQLAPTSLKGNSSNACYLVVVPPLMASHDNKNGQP